MNLNHAELYLLIATRPHGEQIAIHRDGTLSINDASAVLDDERVVAVLRAEGDFCRSDWGVEWSEEQEGFVVENLEGIFESDADALRAAVAEFGLTAEIIDRLDRQVEEASEHDMPAFQVSAMSLNVENFGDFVNVTVGAIKSPCFTIDLENLEWGTAPEDNASTLEKLLELTGFESREDAVTALNAVTGLSGQ